MSEVQKKYPEGSLSFEDLQTQLHRIFEEDEVNVEEVFAVLEAYRSDFNDWRQYAVFDPHRYTRNLVNSGNGKFNLMILCWGEGMGSSIHDHADAHCFVKMLEGSLKETMYSWPAEEGEVGAPMTAQGEKICGRDEVTYINDSHGLHRMENPSHTDRAVSLHLYCPPFSKCLTFDERTGHRRPVKVTFWSEHGVRTCSGGSDESEESEGSFSELPPAWSRSRPTNIQSNAGGHKLTVSESLN